MTPQETKEHCDSHCKIEDHVILVSTFMGEMREAIKNMKGDVNTLFKHNREIITEIAAMRKEIVGVKIKIAIASLMLGAIGAGAFQLGLVFLRKWGING